MMSWQTHRIIIMNACKNHEIELYRDLQFCLDKALFNLIALNAIHGVDYHPMTTRRLLECKQLMKPCFNSAFGEIVKDLQS
jgi:hypothetical protein